MDRTRKFYEELLTLLRCDPSIAGQPGVTVAGHPNRAESHVTAGYKLGEHLVVTCDPAVETTLGIAVVDMEPTLDAWNEVAKETGGELLGASRMQLLGDAGPIVPPLPEGFAYRTFHCEEPEAIDLISALVEVSSEDDLDEAEIEMENLDETIDLVIAPSGQAVAYGSAKPFDLAPNYGDIGVLTHARYRRQNLGVAIVQKLCARLIGEGVTPLYRCDEENPGSLRLSAAMGFQPVVKLTAYRFPTPR